MSDSYSVVYSLEAKSDLKEIYSYLAFTLLVPGTADRKLQVVWDVWVNHKIRHINLTPI